MDQYIDKESIMKNSKIMLMTTAMICTGFLTIQAGTSDLLSSIKGPGFELYNKATQTISIALVVDGVLTTADVLAGKKFTQKIDLTKPVRLGIYNQATKGISTSFISGAITPQPNAVYELSASGKTKYLTWTPSKNPPLYPQTGTFMGLSGKSDSGYPLSSNLSQSQIILKK